MWTTGESNTTLFSSDRFLVEHNRFSDPVVFAHSTRPGTSLWNSRIHCTKQRSARDRGGAGQRYIRCIASECKARLSTIEIR